MKRISGLLLLFLQISLHNATAGNYSWQPVSEASIAENAPMTLATLLEIGSDDADIRSTSIADYRTQLFETYEFRITPVINVPANEVAFDDWSPNNYTKRSGITLRNLYFQNAQFGAGIMQLSKSDHLVGLILDPNDKYAWDATDTLLIQPLGIPAAFYRYQLAPEASLTALFSYAPWSKISKQNLPFGTTESAPHGGTATNFELISETKICENHKITIHASRTNSPWPIDANNEVGKHQSVQGQFEADVYNEYNLGTEWKFESNLWKGGIKAGAYYAEEDVGSRLMAIPYIERSISIFGEQARIGMGYFYSHAFNHGNAFLQNRFDPRLWINNSGVLTFEIPINFCTIKSEFLYDPSGDIMILESSISIPISKGISINANTIYIKGFEDLRDTNHIAGSIGLSYSF